jgi:GT2 family glycosyltransferase
MKGSPDYTTPADTMFISVIILNFNSPNDTVDCIQSLMKTNYPDFEVILIDNGSSDNSTEILLNLEDSHTKNFTFIKNEDNLGFTGGNNLGIKRATGDYILLLNNDTIVEDNFIGKLADKIAQFPDAAAIGPKILYYSEPDKIWFAGGKLDWLYGGVHIGLDELDTGQYNLGRCVEYITGCALLMNKKVIQEIGGLDDRFFAYYEDVDWCLRARKAGYPCVYVPEPVLWHKVGRSFGEKGKKITGRQLYLGTRNKILSLEKNCKQREYIGFLCKQLMIFSPAYIITLILRNDFPLLNAYIMGIHDGIRN